jgi:hypothetical protein
MTPGETPSGASQTDSCRPPLSSRHLSRCIGASVSVECSLLPRCSCLNGVDSVSGQNDIREGPALTWDDLVAAPGVPPAVLARYGAPATRQRQSDVPDRMLKCSMCREHRTLYNR